MLPLCPLITLQRSSCDCVYSVHDETSPGNLQREEQGQPLVCGSKTAARGDDCAEIAQQVMQQMH